MVYVPKGGAAMTVKEIIDLYFNNLITWAEAFDALMAHVNKLFKANALTQRQAYNAEQRIIRWYEGEMNTITLERSLREMGL